MKTRRGSLGDWRGYVSRQAVKVTRLLEFGRFADALDISTQVCNIIRENLGEDHAEYGSCIVGLAAIYYGLGAYDKSRLLLQQALQITRKTVAGENHPDVAQVLDKLAVTELALGNLVKAGQLFRSALKIMRSTLGENNPDYVNTLIALAQLNSDLGKYSAAERLLRKVLKITEKNAGHNHPDSLSSLKNLLSLYKKMNDHRNYVATLSDLAMRYYANGDYDKAEPLLQEAIEVMRKKLGENHPYFAANLDALGLIYHRKGDYDKAEPLLQEAIEVMRKTLGRKVVMENYQDMENYQAYASSLNNLALLYMDIGNYDKAEPLVQEAIEVNAKTLGENDPAYAGSLQNLGKLNSERGNYSAAERLLRKVLKIRKKISGKNHPDYAMTLHNLGLLYMDVGNYDKAEPLVQEAIEVNAKTLGKNHPNYAISLDTLGLLYKHTGKYDKAEPLYQKAIEITAKTLGENHPQYSGFLYNLAFLYVITDRQSEAFTIMKRVLDMEDRLIGQIFSISLEKDRMSYLKTIQQHFYAFLSLVSQFFLSSDIEICTAFDLVLRRKGIVAEAFMAQRDAILSGKYPQFSHKIRELSYIRKMIGRKLLAGPDPTESFEAYKRSLSQFTMKKEKLEAEFAINIPEIRLKQNLQNANRQVIADRVSKEIALIEFIKFNVFDFLAVPGRNEPSWKGAHYLAFILFGKEPNNVKMVDLGYARSIDNKVIDLLQSITNSAGIPRTSKSMTFMKPSRNTIKKGCLLRETVFDPLLTQLGNHKKLYISPDSELARLPFEVLPTGRDTHGYLIDSYQISYLTSSRDVLRFEADTSGLASYSIVAADPDFDLENYQKNRSLRIHKQQYNSKRTVVTFKHLIKTFDRLRGTRVEGKHVAHMLGIRALLEGDVLESKIRDVKSPFVMHIATHGFFLPDPKDERFTVTVNPGLVLFQTWWLIDPMLRSGLVLAGVNAFLKNSPLPNAAEDGILTAEDISGMELSNTELVVLSACDTGRGKLYTGEGVFGLRRAFMLAGAQSLVMSLWNVQDQQTLLLMKYFYRYLLESSEISRTEALQRAKMDLKKDYPNPYFWGSFICQGNPGPLLLNRTNYMEAN